MASGSDPLGLVGTTIAEKYAVESVVGEGGFAIVYRATHLLWKRPVALKVFNALAAVAAEERQVLLDDFIQEGALLAELSERSAAICQARDVGMLTSPRGQAIPYMVLEWLEGRSLESLLEMERAGGRPLRSLDEAIHLLEPIADALALAHKKGIAHRDVKPANVFVLEDTHGAIVGVKLLDFGIAKVVQGAQKMGFGKTAGHITSFTPLYGAPEQFNRSHGATGPWTDVFALALVVAEVVGGRVPMLGDDLVQLGFASANPAVRPTPRVLGVATTDDVEAVFLKAVAVKPEERFQTVGEMWSLLRERVLGSAAPSSRALAGESSSRMPHHAPQAASAASAYGATDTLVAQGSRTTLDPAPPSPTSHASPAPAAGKRSRAVPLVAGLVVLGVAAGAFALSRGGAPPSPRAPLPTSSAVAPVASAAPVASGAAPASSAASDLTAGKCPKGMAYIPAGDFFMGSDDDAAEKDEKPAHKVRLGAYCLDVTEVTVAAYHQCSDRSACLRAGKENRWPGITPLQRKTYDPLCNENDPVAKANHPINCVDHAQSEVFCKDRGARLPTEAEWELAARGPEQRLYPWGDDAPSAKLLNACGSECQAWKKQHPDPNDDAPASMYDDDDGFFATSPVGSFPKGASKYGLQDIVGNVWEWVSDFYGPYTPAKDMQVDPAGPKKGKSRVLRGGAWNGADKSWVKPAYRFAASPDSRGYAFGFRCAKSVDVP
jgi:formylglycine-generating enzyme required for sulfatase activity/serine/threonine protein kinase